MTGVQTCALPIYNLTNNGSTRKFTDFFPENTGRVDYNLNESTRLFVRYSRNALQEERSFHYSTNSSINPADTGNNTPFTRENHNATVQFTKTLNPTTVLDLRAGWSDSSRRADRSRARRSAPRSSASHRLSLPRPQTGSPSLSGRTTKARERNQLTSARSRRPILCKRHWPNR